LFGRKEVAESEKAYDSLFNIHFFFFLTSVLIPNVGIMIRQRVKKNRVEYNIMVAIINLLYFFYLTYLCVSHKWALM
jgi:hypothetical protein